MENLDLKTLSDNMIMEHKTLQAHKELRTQINTLKQENDFIKLILKNLSSYPDKSESSIRHIFTKLQNVYEYCEIQERTVSLEQLNIQSLLTEISSDLRTDLERANIEFFLEKLPQFLGDKPRVEMLFKNIFLFTIEDVFHAKAVHVEHETTKDGNRLIWEITLDSSTQPSSQTSITENSIYLLLAKELASALGSQLSSHVVGRQILVELLFD